MWDALRVDVRQSVRSLRRAPTFSLIVIVTLALAVGATTAVGSLLNALVFRTLAVPHPEQLVALSALEPRANRSGYFYADTFARGSRADRATSCLGLGTASVRKTSALSRLPTAVVTPIASASVTTTIKENVGVRRKLRKECRTSRQRASHTSEV